VIEPFKIAPDGKRVTLRPYQRRTALRLYKEPAVGQLVDMGLGKTITTLTAIRALIKHGKRTGALVVVPLRVLETQVWQDEAKAWSHTKNMTFSVVYGKEKERLQAINAKADIYLTNYESLKWFAKMTRRASQKSKIPMPDILVLDESSFIKNAGSLRFRAIKYRLYRFFKTVTVLSGSPMPNSLLEFWSQIYVLDRGARLGTSYTRFKQRFFEPVDYRQYKWEPREGSTDRVLELIKDIVVRLDNTDWVKMPEIVPNVVPVHLPDNVRTLYRKHEREMFVELANKKVVTAVNAATLSMQCQQIANGALYDDEEDRTSWSGLHDAKLDALQELIDSHPGQRLMVAYWFRHDLERLRFRFKKARVMDKHNANQTKLDWNAGKIPLLFVQPRSAGHGLNMQYGGHIIVFFSMTWSLEAHDQLIGRLRREDNPWSKIICHYLVCQNTVDEAILDASGRGGTKDRNQRYVLDALRDYAQRKAT
jgi:SNF2 family DNA or RNA helicase